MKKFKNYLLFMFVLVFLFIGKTNAVLLTESEIPDGSYIIGTHMFTYSEQYPYTDLYDGNVNTAVVMLGSASFETEDIKSQDEFIIYNKLFDGFWLDTLSGDLIEKDSYDFEILYVNGSCIDPSCSGKKYDVTFRYNNDVTSNLVKTYYYSDVIEEPATPTKLGHKFLCWTLENSDDCYDFSTPVESDLVLDAAWSAYDYKITYVDTVSNNTKLVECNFTAGSECTYPDFTDFFVLKEGYTFSGWSLATAGEKVYTSSSSFENLFGDVTEFTLYSIFNSSDYTISYVLNGGTFANAVSPVTVYDPSMLQYDIPTPTRIGYKFDGWRVTKGDASISNGTININAVSNIEVEASWIPISYNVVYNGINLNSSSCKYDSDCLLNFDLIVPEEGKKIDNIEVKVGNANYSIGSKVRNLTTDDGTNISVVVTFADISYHVMYDYNGGALQDDSSSNPNSITMVENILVEHPVKTGYTFNGWNVVSGDVTIVEDVSGKDKISLSTTGDVKLVALWVPNSYTLVYNNIVYGTCYYDKSCNLNDLDDVPSGKEFIHWSLNNNALGDVVYNLSSVNNDRLDIEPVFNNITYNIIYKYNGGDAVNTAKYDVDTKSILLNNPVKTGYDFNSWSIETDDSLASISKTDNNYTLNLNGSIGDIVLVASYNAKSYNVSYDLNGGTANDISGHSCTYESCNITNVVPTKDKYDFAGWINPGTGYVYDSGSTIKIDSTNDIQLVAKWSNKDSYKINYHLNGGTFADSNGDSIVPNTSYLAGEVVTFTVPIKTGYMFNGWELEDGTIVTGTTVDSREDFDLYASFTPITYSITYHVKDALEIENNTLINYTYDVEYQLEDFLGDFADKKLTLLGWSTSENGNLYYGNGLSFKNFATESMNIDLYPVVQTIEDDYIISYYLDGGSFVDIDSVKYSYNQGDALTLPEVTKRGYRLVNWKLDDERIVDGTETDINKDIVLIPVWELVTYNVNYTGTGINMPSTTYTVLDGSIRLPLNGASGLITSNTANFVLWEDNNSSIVPVCSDDSNYACFTLPKQLSDLTFTAHFDDEVYTVTYNASVEDFRGNAHSDNGTIRVNCGDLITGLPTEIAYKISSNNVTETITGWTLDGVAIDIDTYRVLSDVTLVATFN